MIDMGLVKAINEFAAKTNTIELSKSDAEKYLSSLETKFIKKPGDYVWWWEGVSGPYVVLTYDTSYQWEVTQEVLSSIEGLIHFVPTDDERGPWPVYRGLGKDVLFILSETWQYEYFVADPNLDWLIFDTHHNSFIFCGKVIIPPLSCQWVIRTINAP